MKTTYDIPPTIVSLKNLYYVSDTNKEVKVQIKLTDNTFDFLQGEHGKAVVKHEARRKL